MTRLISIVLLSSLIVGCHSASSLSPEDRRTLERRTILDEALARTDLQEEWALADRDLPSDVWTTHPKIGRVNDSRFKREMGVTHKLLDGIKPRVQSMGAPELLDSLKVLPPGAFYAKLPGVVYYVWRDGNEMIMEELKRRSKDELEALRSHTNDLRTVFTDDSREYLTVGDVVHRTLGDKQW
jgi:hypothetical protein